MPEQEASPIEFKIQNYDVYFKEGAMPYFSHYGRLYIAVPTGTENQFAIKKFDLEQQNYIHTNELTSFEIYGQTVEVVDGFAIAIQPETPPEPEPVPTATTNDLMTKLKEQEQDNLNRDELLLEQQLLLLNIDLNTTV